MPEREGFEPTAEDRLLLAWHDVTCPESHQCRSRALHALSTRSTGDLVVRAARAGGWEPVVLDKAPEEHQGEQSRVNAEHERERDRVEAARFNIANGLRWVREALAQDLMGSQSTPSMSVHVPGLSRALRTFDQYAPVVTSMLTDGPMCPVECSRPWDQSEERWCVKCNRHQPTCTNDHCMECGDDT